MFVAQTLSVQVPAPAVNHHRPGDPPAHLPASLLRSPYVYVRVDAVRRPLTTLYGGPYQIQQSGQKTFVLLKAGEPWTVSADWLARDNVTLKIKGHVSCRLCDEQTDWYLCDNVTLKIKGHVSCRFSKEKTIYVTM